MIMSNIKDICFAYFNGASTLEQEKMITAFVQESPENMSQFNAWEAEWKGQRPACGQVLKFGKLKSELKSRNRARKIRLYSICAAAAAALLLTVGITWQSVPAEVLPAEMVCVKTDFNEKTKVVLPDESVVWLNANTTLTYSEDFVADSREVVLSGEAFFDVVTMPDTPFVVHVSGNDITVKGTKFNVTAYDQEAEIAASLVEGAIVFNSEKVSVEMVPGEQLVYNVLTEDLAKTKVDTRSSFSWINGKLDYASISLQKLLVRLTSLYGVEFRYTPNKYKNRNFRIKLNDNEPIEDVLSAISIILPIEYSINEDIVTIVEK